MLLKIVFRNILLRLKKYYLLLLIVATTIGVMFLSNTVFEQVELGQKRAYIDSITGQYSISEVTDESNTIFGSSIPIVGLNDYVKPLDSVDALSDALLVNPAIENLSFQISTFGLVGIDGANEPSVIFGVDIDQYKKAFKELKVETVPAFENPLVPYIYISRKVLTSLESSISKKLKLGEKILVTSSNGESFAIRELTLCGILDYGIADEQVARLSLVDADTARALSGMLITADEPRDNSDSVLQSIRTGTKEIEDSQFILSDLENNLRTDETHENLSKIKSNTWNYATFSIKDGFDSNHEIEKLREYFGAKSLNLTIQGWRETAGGSAQMVYVIQIMINIGIIIIMIASILILNNSIGITVYERMSEIGTMRALGAQKVLVVAIIGFELLFLVFVASVVGIVVTTIVSAAIFGEGLQIDNPMFISLLGTHTFGFALTAKMIMVHLVAGLVIGVLSLFNPLRIAISISPREAIKTE